MDNSTNPKQHPSPLEVIAHQQKKMNIEDVRAFRDRFQLPIPNDQLESLPYLKFADGSPELEYMRSRHDLSKNSTTTKQLNP